MLGAVKSRLRAARSRLGGAGRRVRDMDSPLVAIRERLRSVRYAIADILFVLARVPRAVAHGARGFWRALPPVTRRRLVAALGSVAVVGVAVTLVVPNLPCEFPGGDECPPANDAVELVPAGTLAYVHANVDTENEQAERASEVAARMPMVSQQVIAQVLPLLGGEGAAIEPWFGGEVALAVLGSGDGEQVRLLEAADAGAAREYAAAIAAGPLETSEYRDIEIAEDPEGTATAVIDGFLVLGPPDAVREVVRTATEPDEAGTLADDPAAAAALDELPEHRVAEAYLSPDGIESLVADPRGALATLEPLVDADASRGAAVALSAGEEGFELASRSVLDPERAESEQGFFGAFEAFSPELAGDLDPETLVYLGIASPQETLEALLSQATVGAPGIAAGVSDLIERLRGAADVDLQRDLLDAITGEAAFAVVPRDRAADEEEEDEEATAATITTPYLEFLASEVDESAARDALARLQGPIIREFNLSPGGATLGQRMFGEVEAQVLRLSPVAELLYAIADSRLVIANDEAAVERLAEGADGGLGASERYRVATEGLPEEPALLAYLDLEGLLSFAERSGLAEDTAYGAFAPDLRRLGSLGLAVSHTDGTLAADARILVE